MKCVLYEQMGKNLRLIEDLALKMMKTFLGSGNVNKCNYAQMICKINIYFSL